MPAALRHRDSRGPNGAAALRRSAGAACRVAALLAAMLGGGAGLTVHAADLAPRRSPHEVTTRPLRRPYVIPAPPLPEVDPPPPLAVAPGPPPSQHGYYGYYGFDLAGTPYEGLYSANVLCLRSIATPYGYRTVNVCR